MGRHEQREQLFKLLFRISYHPAEDMPEQVRLFFEDIPEEEETPQGEERTLTQKDCQYIQQRFESIADHLTDIDRLINEKTQGWDTKRIGKVELTILRLAVYEIRYDDQIPTGVAINEAVEIAKKYGQDNSGSFINAILAKFADQAKVR
jgi:N utilization substance protein B